MKKLIIILFCVLMTMYLATSFVFLSFTPVDWGVTGRIVICFLLIGGWGWVIDQYRAN